MSSVVEIVRARRDMASYKHNWTDRKTLDKMATVARELEERSNSGTAGMHISDDIWALAQTLHNMARRRRDVLVTEGKRIARVHRDWRVFVKKAWEYRRRREARRLGITFSLLRKLGAI